MANEFKSYKKLDWDGKCCPFRGSPNNMRAAICNAQSHKQILSRHDTCFHFCRDQFNEECSLFQKSKKGSAFIRQKRRERSAKKPRECGCGCEGLTKGGEFLPGHDARHKGNLKRGVKALREKKKLNKGETKYLQEMRSELERRDW
ncbi:MAG: hypothetical protein PF495_09020 [Spirochaetales bacterium]|jgi:hypothetical protein|nr:hypothetical protein [Spirochaetales bacterium]